VDYTHPVFEIIVVVEDDRIYFFNRNVRRLFG
jgi:hypothetical protein